MSVILVLEQDAGYAGRISSVLRTAGHEVHVVQNMDHALQIAGARPPQLFIASGSNAGAAEMLDRFSRRRGGPGSVVLLPSTLAEQVQAADYRADEILTKPFTEPDLLGLARRFLAGAPAPPPAPPRSQLTSADIFGDVLAEVEAEAQKSAPGRRPSTQDEVNKKLEETLAGVFPMPRTPAAAPPPPAPAPPQAPRLPTAVPAAAAAPGPTAQNPVAPRPAPAPPAAGGLPANFGAPPVEAPRRARPLPPSADEIDDLLDKTLSSLELPRQRRPAPNPPAGMTAAPAPAAPPAAAPPAAAPPAAAAALPPRPAASPFPLAPAPATTVPVSPSAPIAPAPAAFAPAPASIAPAPPPIAPAPPPIAPAPLPITPAPAPIAAAAPPAFTYTPPAAPTPAPIGPPPATAPAPQFGAPAPSPAPQFGVPAPSPFEAWPQTPVAAPAPTPAPTFAPSPAARPVVPEAAPYAPFASASPAAADVVKSAAPATTAFSPFSPEEKRPAADSFASAFGPGTFDSGTFDSGTPIFSSPETAFDAPSSLPVATLPAASVPDPWASDLWPATDSFASAEPAPAAAPFRPESGSFDSFASSPSSFDADFGDFGAASPQSPPTSPWAPAPSEDTGWSVSSFEDQPTPRLATLPEASAFPGPSTFPGPSEPASFPSDFANAAAPADFLSAFAPPSETGSFVKKLPLGPAGKVSTSDFGLPSESDPGLHAALDGVLQIRGDHNTGRPEGDLEGTPFGDYRLMERVAIGGMAEVWRARRRGVEGFQKTVAIKKILSHLTGSVDFVTMFIDEAKLAAQLTHNNIIQIYDLGKVDQDFYIAMEYVEGWDLRTILAAGRDRGLPLPLPLALAIGAAVARALDYAHRKRDFANRALGLVHRDVSPQNVMISHEGEIKLCDFGIVKAVSKASTTQMGALKGKLQYMSPEQAWGREVDARSDIFSLGSVLFEVLTGSKLFTGDSEIGVLDAVRDCRVRSPREIVPSIPEEVERIVFRALAKNPEDRYTTAGQLEKDIAAVLDGLRLTPGQGDLGEYLQLLFNTPLLRNQAAATAPAKALPPGTGIAVPPSPTTSHVPPLPAPAAKSNLGLIVGAAVVLILLLVLGWFFFLREKPAEETPPPAVTAPAEGQAAAPGQAEPGAAPQAGSGDLVRQLVTEELDARQKEIQKEYDEKRRKIEEELARVQRENAKSGAGGGN